MAGVPPSYSSRWLINPRYQPMAVPGDRDAWDEITPWPGYEPTPLLELTSLARDLTVAAVYYKDEGGRFGLGSFKALGGAYAVLRMLQRRLDGSPDAAELRSGALGEITQRITVTTATDGNHGRSVAWGAQQFGCRAVIYIPADCSIPRADALAALDADVIRVEGGYDDAVTRCAEDAGQSGRVIISNTSWDGYRDIPRQVIQGYAVMAEEALRQLPDGSPPSHIFIQGGVGALPAAICAHFSAMALRPRVIVVEPETAACLFVSAEAGKASTAPAPVYSVMAGLNCGSASPIAWDILDRNAFAFMTVPDHAAADCMRMLAGGKLGARPIVAGESAVAGLAALLSCRDEIRDRLGLQPDSRILLFGTEGATDPDIYAKMVGHKPKLRE